MRTFQDTFETRKGSFVNAFPIYMTVPLTNLSSGRQFNGRGQLTGVN